MNGNQTHDENDVLYIAFTGSNAVPGADGAQWDADGFDTFESSLASIGDRLLQRIGGGNDGGRAALVTLGRSSQLLMGKLLSKRSLLVRGRLRWRSAV